MRRVRAHEALIAVAAVAVVVAVALLPQAGPHRAPVHPPTTVTTTSPQPMSSCRSVDGYPDPLPSCTNGVFNPQVTQATIGQTICKTGWTSTIRPPAAVTAKIKTERLIAYGDPPRPQDYELDHFIPLEMGGDPIARGNLWPEPYAIPDGAHVKDQVENAGKAAICAGRLSLTAAQTALEADWKTFGRSLGVTVP